MDCLCNSRFISQYCHIGGETLCINEYILNKNKYNDNELKCSNNHQLTFINDKYKKPHFRHKFISDLYKNNPMTDWHAEWQGNFPNTEKIFDKLEGQIKTRRCNVVLNNKQILEIQNSNYNRQEILEKKNDMALHGIEIIWLIDGNYDIDKKYLKYSNKYYLKFKHSSKWQYKSFLDYDYIYIDINEKIYKIYPKKVKNNMIDVQPPQKKINFINALKNKINLYNDNESNECTLYVKYASLKIKLFFEINNYDHFINELKNELENIFKKYLKIKNDIKEINPVYNLKSHSETENIIITKKNKKSVNCGKKWTDKEEKQLLNEIAQNLNKKEIAENHNRTIGGITSKIKKIAHNMFNNNVSIVEIINKTKLTEKQILENKDLKIENEKVNK